MYNFSVKVFANETASSTFRKVVYGQIMFENRFRDLVAEPKDVVFSRIKVDKVLEYFHARNDVTHCIDQDNNHYIIKFARYTDSNFKNEVAILQEIKKYSWLNVPRVVEHGSYKNIDYIVFTYIRGFRISQRIDVYKRNTKIFCNTFGKNIGMIHTIEGKFEKVNFRKFHTLVDNDTEDINLKSINSWLAEHSPISINECFVHGDHHYANILWSENGIEATLDWELAGIGNREYDIAWSTVVRPGQHFFLTEYEEDEILNGYQKANTFDFFKYQYYKILVISHFYKYRNETGEYKNWMNRELKKITSIEMVNCDGNPLCL